MNFSWCLNNGVMVIRWKDNCVKGEEHIVTEGEESYVNFLVDSVDLVEGN